MNKSLLVDRLSGYVQLTKPIIILSVSLSALVGFVLARGAFSPGWLAVCSGVMLVAAGSSVFNQIQEAAYDKMMERTRRRPIPAGTISRNHAIVFALLISLSGVLILWFLASPISSLLAIITLAGYNLVYTPLKSITFFALLPGALVGALPPAIGWTAGGGSLQHPLIILVAFFFFMGQLPHFWLILLRHEKDYLRAGFPALTSFFNQRQIGRLTMTWVLALMAAAIFLPFFGVIQSRGIAAGVWVLTLLLVSVFFHELTGSKPLRTNRAFIILNSYFLFMMLILIADSLAR